MGSAYTQLYRRQLKYSIHPGSLEGFNILVCVTISASNRNEENREDSSVVWRRRLKRTIDACSRRQMGSAYTSFYKR